MTLKQAIEMAMKGRRKPMTVAEIAEAAQDSEDAIRTRLEARAARLGVEQVSKEGDEQHS